MVSPPTEFQRVIVIGDVHGCTAELEELLAAVEQRPGDRFVFLGDLVDRGPDSIGSVRLARAVCDRNPGSTLIVGNHEIKLIARFKSAAKGNPQADLP